MTPSNSNTPPLGYLIYEVSRLWKRRFEEEARLHGITLPQWRTLAQLSKNHRISQAALAALIDTDPMTMSGILDRLEKHGLIERVPDPDDSRAKQAQLTPKAVELVASAKNIGLGLFERALQGVSEADRAILTDSLTCMRNNLAGLVAEEKEMQE